MSSIRLNVALGLGLALAVLSNPSAQADVLGEPTAPLQLSIRSQPLSDALNEFAAQAHLQIMFDSTLSEGHTAPALAGRFSPRAALERLLANTRLGYVFVDPRTITLVSAQETRTAIGTGHGDAPVRVGPGLRVAQSRAETMQQVESSSEGPVSKYSAASRAEDQSSKGVPEILVKGSRSFNTDIRRTRDDAQPYVIFDRSQIERSGAVSMEDFLKNRLPMNTVGRTNAQAGLLSQGTMSEVNLRGLGTGQTVVLVDGRRIAGSNIGGSLAQPDLNGIPMSAVERIEVLPTTASGIYGGSATGGVINVILRRDYAATDLRLNYENAFDTDVGLRRIDLASGLSLEGGKTRVLLAGSYSDQSSIAVQDRDFYQRHLDQALAGTGGDYVAVDPTAQSPAKGRTPNIRSGNGQNLVLKNGTNLGSTRTFVPVGYAGTATDNGAALVANAGKQNLELSSSAQGDGGGRQSLLTYPTVKSLTATVRREFSSKLEAFVEAAHSDTEGHLFLNPHTGFFTLPATAPNNPFQQEIRVSAPLAEADGETGSEVRNTRFVGGVIVSLPGGWKSAADFTWNRFKVEYHRGPSLNVNTNFLDAANSGQIDVLRDIDAFPLNIASYLQPSEFTIQPFKSALKDMSLRLTGPVGTLPGGRPIVSTLFERRDEDFAASSLQSSTLADRRFFYPARSQVIDSAYAEIRVPLISAQNRMRWAEMLELQLAGRYDRYSLEGATSSITIINGVPSGIESRIDSRVTSTNPTVALRYQPLQDVMFRASYGTGFLPPTVNQILPVPSALGSSTANPLTDPRRGDQQFVLPPGQMIQEGNPNLRPEESESVSVGVVLTPRFADNLRLSVDYLKIDKSDNIAFHPASTQGVINDEALFPGRVVRGSPAGDPFGVGPIVLVDASLLNISKANIEAYDVQLDYRLDTASRGTFDWYALATWQTHYRTRLLDSQPTIENVGYSFNNPLKFKANAGLNWRQGGWTLGWSARYFDSYRVTTNVVSAANTVIIRNQGSATVASQIYHDLFASYRFDEHSGGRWAGLLANTELQAGVKNVLNTEPPLDQNYSGKYYSPYGDPRLATYYLTIKHSFE